MKEPIYGIENILKTPIRLQEYKDSGHIHPSFGPGGRFSDGTMDINDMGCGCYKRIIINGPGKGRIIDDSLSSNAGIVFDYSDDFFEYILHNL